MVREDIFMKLVAFGARNYLSFKEGFEISLAQPVKGETNQAPTNALCIVGANASGKSNVLRALTYIAQFCCYSFNANPDEQLKIATYGFGPNPALFFVEFTIGETWYSYEAELTEDEVVRETLARKVKKTVKLFERSYDALETIAEFDPLKKIRLRKNVSIISIAHQYELDLLSDVYTFFSNIVSNIDPFFGETTHSGRSLSIFTASMKYKNSPDLFAFIKKKLAEADTGITDIFIQEGLTAAQKEYYYPVFVHDNPEGSVEVPYMLESSGTRLLYTQLGLYKRVLDGGGVLLLDEFDNNLHPDLLGWLLDFFVGSEANRNEGQLIFTSHNTAILDKLTKYQVVAVAKEDNESFLYRLDELPGAIIRNDRSLEAIYKSGKVGGTPSL